jgi:hypothetical protein
LNIKFVLKVKLKSYLMNSLSRYQDNINSFSMEAPETIDFNFKCFPLIYCENENQDLECSNKIILPSSILREISKYNEIEYPLHFKINNSEILFTPSEFKEFNEGIFIPQHFIENLGIEIGSMINLTLLNFKVNKGKSIKIKPHTSNFLEIMDPKHFLENHLTKRYTTLSKGQTIIIPNTETNTISIIDTDLEVDFEAPWDYVEPENMPKNEETETFESCKRAFKLGKFDFGINKPKIKEKEIVEDKPISEGRKLGTK